MAGRRFQLPKVLNSLNKGNWIMSLLSKTLKGPSFYGPSATGYQATILHKLFFWSFFVISWLPYVWVMGVVSLAARARAYLGYWPSPSHPDPKSLPFEFHYEALWGLFDCLKWSILFAFAYYFLNRLILKRSSSRVLLQVYLVGWGVIIGMILIPRINFAVWFFD